MSNRLARTFSAYPRLCFSRSKAIGIGGSFAAPPLPHHRAYGSVHGGSVAASCDGRCQGEKTAGGEEGVGQSGLEGGVPTEPPGAVPARAAAAVVAASDGPIPAWRSAVER